MRFWGVSLDDSRPKAAEASESLFSILILFLSSRRAALRFRAHEDVLDKKDHMDLIMHTSTVKKGCHQQQFLNKISNQKSNNLLKA